MDPVDIRPRYRPRPVSVVKTVVTRPPRTLRRDYFEKRSKANVAASRRICHRNAGDKPNVSSRCRSPYGARYYYKRLETLPVRHFIIGSVFLLPEAGESHDRLRPDPRTDDDDDDDVRLRYTTPTYTAVSPRNTVSTRLSTVRNIARFYAKQIAKRAPHRVWRIGRVDHTSLRCNSSALVM